MPHRTARLSLTRCPAQAAIDLSEGQQLDLIHLRRIFYGRLGQLLRERKQLLSQVAGDTSDVYRAMEAVPEFKDVAQHLRDNGLAEYRAYCQFASAFFRGVRPLTETRCAVSMSGLQWEIFTIWTHLCSSPQSKKVHTNAQSRPPAQCA